MIARAHRSLGRLLVVALVIGAVGLVVPVARADPAAGATAAVKLYVSSPRTQDAPASWTALDPATLRDEPGGAAFSGSAPWLWAASADGLTLVSIDAPLTRPTTVTVYDARSGQVRGRFQAADGAADPLLSADGTRLVVQAADTRDGWDVFDTGSGRRLSHISADFEVGNPWLFANVWLDPAGRRLYRLAFGEAAGPAPVQLVAFDTGSGREVGRMALPNVLGQDISYTAGKLLIPAVAISPDSRTIAVVHADEDAMTLVDATRLAVERTVPLTRSRGLLDRLLGLVPLAPQAAVAKSFSGAIKQAVFSPDGQRLYVFGQWSDTRVVETAFASLGLTVVNVATGRIVASLPTVSPLAGVLPAPNGRDVYAYTTDSNTTLLRLDATDLAREAERTFAGPRSVLLWPSVRADSARRG